MFQIFNLFRRKKRSLADDEVLWKESFTHFKKSRFKNETAENYISNISTGSGLTFSLKKKNFFAWCSASDFSYSDFDAGCSFIFKNPEGYSAAGMLLRMGNDYNYYYFLVSNRGYFRIDCVFNGNPLKRVGWTSLGFPLKLEEPISIRVIVWGEQFIFLVNGIQVAKLSDDTVSTGFVTFCAQNYNEADEASFLLKNFYVNPLLIEVEAAYSKNDFIPQPQKLLLARSFFGSGMFLPAAVQMKGYFDTIDKENAYVDSDAVHQGQTLEHLAFYGEIFVNLALYEEALDCFDRVLGKAPEDKNYLLEKGNILYLQRRYNDLKEFLFLHEDILSENSIYQNLLGHAFFYLDDPATAAIHYEKAALMEKKTPLYFFNSAEAYVVAAKNEKSKQGRKKKEDDSVPVESAAEQQEMLLKSADYYAESAVIFFRQENLDEAKQAAKEALIHLGTLSSTKGKTVTIAIEDIAVKAENVLAKILFQEGQIDKAAERLKILLTKYEEKCESEVFFLYGHILLLRGDIEDAALYIKKACEKEDYYLYWQKLSEIYKIIGKDYKTPLLKAYKLEPDDGYINTLLGNEAYENGDLSSAEKYFKKAFDVWQAGGENESLYVVNYARVLNETGKQKEAFKMLEDASLSADVSILKAELYEAEATMLDSDSFTVPKAEAEYKKALSIDPENLTVVKAAASYYFRTEQFMKAQELLSSFKELPEDGEIYNLVGNLARVRGAFEAAFDAYKISLSISYDPVVALNYIEGLCETMNFTEADRMMKQFFTASTLLSHLEERKKLLMSRIERGLF